MNSLDPQHRSFRAWALQQDLISLLGGGSEWRARSPDLGLEDSAPRDLEEVRGQSYLRQQLAPNPRLPLRTRTSLALWIGALITDTLNQWGPTGLAMPTGAFTLVASAVVVMIIFTAIVYPRLSVRPFAVVEQIVLVIAYVIIAYQCSVTGGSHSPYMVWFILAAFYPSYLLPERQAWLNIALVAAFSSSTFFLGDGAFSTDALVIVVTLVATAMLIGFTLMRQHRFEANMERAVQFLALADPLTGVANLRALEQMTGELARVGGRRFAVVMADMNGLKGANAVFGDEAGDGMILRMSRLMMNVSDKQMQVARIGGDEFAVVMPDATRPEAEAWIVRFEELVDAHNLEIKGRLPQVSAALGIAVYPEDGTSASELIDSADREMYAQKAPVVTPPYEIEVVSSSGPSHQLRAARFANAPRQVVETRERFEHAALNFLTIGALLCAASFTPFGGTAALGFGLFLFAMAALSMVGSRQRRAHALSIVLDAVTIVGSYLTFEFTGGADSPIQISMIIAVAFYAQYLDVRRASLRVGLVLIGWSIAFWTTGFVGEAGEALYATLLAASLIIAALLQVSQRSLTASLALVRESATHDPLTKALNAHAFDADISRLVARATRDGDLEHRPALLIVDIDDFRSINTRYMHSGGDQILVEIHERLESAARDGTVYRTGGDEFAVLFEAADLNAVRRLAGECAEALSFRAIIDGRSRDRVSCSTGYAIWNVSMSADELVDLVGNSLAADKSRRSATQPEATNMML